MNRDLTILKVACCTLRDLKKDERKLKCAIVKSAAARLLLTKTAADKIANWVYQRDTYGSDYDDLSWYWGKPLNWAGRALNHLNNDWFQDAVLSYGNSSEFKTEADRQKYFKDVAKRRWGVDHEKEDPILDWLDKADANREDYYNHRASGAMQQEEIRKRALEGAELKDDYTRGQADRYYNAFMKDQDKRYNTAGLNGGITGLGINTSIAATYMPKMYPGRYGMMGGMPIGGPGMGYGRYGGYGMGYGGYGRMSMGYGGYGRYGGYGGYRGYGGYGRYGMMRPGMPMRYWR